MPSLHQLYLLIGGSTVAGAVLMEFIKAILHRLSVKRDELKKQGSEIAVAQIDVAQRQREALANLSIEREKLLRNADQVTVENLLRAIDSAHTLLTIHTEQIDSLKRGYEEQILLLKTNHESMLAKVHEEHRAALLVMQREHAEAMSRMSVREEALKKEVQKLTRQVRTLTERLEQYEASNKAASEAGGPNVHDIQSAAAEQSDPA